MVDCQRARAVNRKNTQRGDFGGPIPMNEFENRRDRPSQESRIAAELGALLKDIPVGAAISEKQAADLLGTLEYFLPLHLALDFPEWKWESLDGFYFVKAEKNGDGSARFLGTCILISDQTMAPFFLELSLTDSGDSLASLRLFLGEKGEGTFGVSRPGWGTSGASKLTLKLLYQLDSIQWAYLIERDF